MGYKSVLKFGYFLTIAGSVACMLLAVIGGIARYVSPLSVPNIALLGFVLPALLLVNIVLLCYWGIVRRKRWFIFPLLALLFNIPFLLGTFEFHTNSWLASSEKKTNSVYTVASYNMAMLFRTREADTVRELTDSMKQQDVDIACLQEFFYDGGWWNKELTDSLFNIWPYHYRTEQYPDFLPLAIYSKYPISNGHHVHFDDCRNSFIYCDVDLPAGKTRVFSAHLQTTGLSRQYRKVKEAWRAVQDEVEADARLDNTWGEYSPLHEETKDKASSMRFRALHTARETFIKNLDKRVVQAKEMQKLISESPYPVIVCGDFNSQPSSYVYRTISKELQDGFVNCGNSLASSYRFGGGFFRIDYILYSDIFEGVAYQTKPWTFSDHYPVFMQVKKRL